MIHAKLTQNRDGQYTACRISGHADYAEEGHDIVCAAVSILSVNCSNSLETLVHFSPMETVHDGFLSFSLPHHLTADQKHDSQLLMQSFVLGLESLAEQYPQYLKLSIVNGGKYDDQT